MRDLKIALFANKKEESNRIIKEICKENKDDIKSYTKEEIEFNDGTKIISNYVIDELKKKVDQVMITKSYNKLDLDIIKNLLTGQVPEDYEIIII